MANLSNWEPSIESATEKIWDLMHGSEKYDQWTIAQIIRDELSSLAARAMVIELDHLADMPEDHMCALYALLTKEVWKRGLATIESL